MKRRHFLVAIAALPLAAHAQQKTWVIGLLDAGERLEWWAAFRAQFRQLGYAEGKNVTLEARYAKGKLEDLPRLTDELIRRKVDLFVTSGTAAALAAKHATDTIPVVMATGNDVVSLGLVRSLSRPGENVTGLTSLSSDLTVKRFALLREMFPALSRVAVIWHRENVSSSSSVRDLIAAADAVKVSVQNLPTKDASGLPAAFDAAAREHAQAVMTVHSPLIYRERKNLADLALQHKLPTMNGAAEYVDAGGLASYAASYPDLFRRAAVYVDRILRGAKPAEMPVEQPALFELVINQKTAKAIGATIPAAITLRADRVVSAL
jgi:putative ABC transport system substrate-binding protein